MRDEEIEVCKLLIPILISKLRNKMSAQKWSECEIYIKKWSECEFSLIIIFTVSAIMMLAMVFDMRT